MCFLQKNKKIRTLNKTQKTQINCANSGKPLLALVKILPDHLLRINTHIYIFLKKQDDTIHVIHSYLFFPT